MEIKATTERGKKRVQERGLESSVTLCYPFRRYTKSSSAIYNNKSEKLKSGGGIKKNHTLLAVGAQNDEVDVVISREAMNLSCR